MIVEQGKLDRISGRDIVFSGYKRQRRPSLEEDIDRLCKFIAIWKIHYKDTNILLRTYKCIANLITKCKRIEDSAKYCFHSNPGSLL